MIRKAHMSTERQAPNQLHHDGVDATIESDDYLAKRTLRSGSAGWVLLAGLGVSYVISGDYAGWNFGLAQGGWGGLAIAAVIIAGMYLAMVLGMAEMSSALPAAGGGYTFARRAMGPGAASSPAPRSSSSTRSRPPRSPPSSARTCNP